MERSVVVKKEASHMITRRRIARLFLAMLIPALILRWGPANLDRDGWRLLSRALLTLDPQAVVSAQTFHRYVKADGRASGACATPETACSLDYAIRAIPCQQTISIAAGTYNSGGGYVFKTFCTATTQRDWRGQGTVIATGIVESPPHTAWTLSKDCDGRQCQYTYEMPFDHEVKGYFPYIAHQPGANVPPIRTFEHNLGGGTGLQSHAQAPFDFTTATPGYAQRSTLAQVELQFGTFAYLNKKIYLHLYEDTGPPRADHRIGIGRANAGAFIMDGGSGERFENIQFWHAFTGGGYCIQLTQPTKWITLSDIVTKGCAWIISGVGHLIERPWAEAFVSQGIWSPPSAGGVGCQNANPTFGVNECFNENGAGDQFSIANAWNIIVRGGLSEKAWGGHLNIVNATNVFVQNFEARYSQNHLCGVINTDRVTLDGVSCISAQESIYSQENADHGNRDLTVKNSVFWPNAFWTGTMDRNVHFFNNIFSAAVSIGPTAINDPGFRSDCNVVIESRPTDPTSPEGFVFRYPTGPTYSLQEWRKATGQDLHSRYVRYARGWPVQFRTWTMNLKPWVVHPYDLHPASSTVEIANLDPACTPRYAGPFGPPATGATIVAPSGVSAPSNR